MLPNRLGARHLENVFMSEPPDIWRDRLRQALLGELTSQELRAGYRTAVAHAIAERRLAAAGYRARKKRPPDLDELPASVRAALGLAGNGE